MGRLDVETQPGWKPAKEGRPWWAIAIGGGFGAVLAVIYALNPLVPPARANETRPPQHDQQQATMSAPDPTRLDRIEQRLNDIERSLGRIEGRLERSPR